MALTKSVIKKSVTNPQSKLYIITFNLKVSDGVNNVIDQDFSCEYRPGENVADKLKEMREKMQEEINRYKDAIDIFNNPKMDTLVNNLSEGLIL